MAETKARGSPASADVVPTGLAELARRVRAERERRRWSARELARRAEVSSAFVHRLEHSKHLDAPRTDNLARVAAALGEDVQEYLRLAGHVPAQASDAPETDRLDWAFRAVQQDPDIALPDEVAATMPAVARQSFVRLYERATGVHLLSRGKAA